MRNKWFKIEGDSYSLTELYYKPFMVQKQLSDFVEHRSCMKAAEKISQPKGAMKIRAKIICSGVVYEPLM